MSEAESRQLEPAALEYGQRPRLGWTSRHRRGIILLALLIAIAGPIWWNWQTLKHRALWLYWSHRAVAHMMPAPADLEVVGSETERLATNPDYVLHPPAGASTQPSAYYAPMALRQLASFDVRLASMGNGPVIFMGTLRRPDGAARSVIISGSHDWNSTQMLWGSRVTILPLPRWFDPLPTIVSPPAGRPVAINGNALPVYYRSGVADPKNLSHVIFQYAIMQPAQPAHTVRILHPVNVGSTTILPGPLLVPAAPAKVFGQGEIDAFLHDDDSIHFALRGPGKLFVPLQTNN